MYVSKYGFVEEWTGFSYYIKYIKINSRWEIINTLKINVTATIKKFIIISLYF